LQVSESLERPQDELLGSFLKVERARRSILVTKSVSPSRRYSRQRFSSGLPASTPERFSLKAFLQPSFSNFRKDS